jgi:hypothetical protein
MGRVAEPCMCGDCDCRFCGPLQGFRPRYGFRSRAKRYADPDEWLEPICPECERSFLQEDENEKLFCNACGYHEDED